MSCVVLGYVWRVTDSWAKPEVERLTDSLRTVMIRRAEVFVKQRYLVESQGLV